MSSATPTKIRVLIVDDSALVRQLLTEILRADPALRDAYLAVKWAAVEGAPDSRARYNELKQDFIARAKRQALGT